MIQLYKTVVIRQWHSQNVNDSAVQNSGYQTVTQSKREWVSCTKQWFSDSDTIKTWMSQLYKTVVIRQWHNQNVNDSTVQNSGYQTVTQSKREWFRCTKPCLTDTIKTWMISCTKLWLVISDNQNVNDSAVQKKNIQGLREAVPFIFLTRILINTVIQITTEKRAFAKLQIRRSQTTTVYYSTH